MHWFFDSLSEKPQSRDVVYMKIVTQRTHIRLDYITSNSNSFCFTDSVKIKLKKNIHWYFILKKEKKTRAFQRPYYDKPKTLDSSPLVPLIPYSQLYSSLRNAGYINFSGWHWYPQNDVPFLRHNNRNFETSTPPGIRHFELSVVQISIPWATEWFSLAFKCPYPRDIYGKKKQFTPVHPLWTLNFVPLIVYTQKKIKVPWSSLVIYH